jgi:hypothetical protein
MDIEFKELGREDFESFLKDELRYCHPTHLVEVAFPEDVMKAICSDHHKSSDGAFVISYDYFSKKWYISQPGYVREVEVEGDTYLDAASKFLSAIRKENAQRLLYEVRDRVNQKLPDDISVDISPDAITIYKCVKGENRMRQMAFRDCKGKSNEEIERIALEVITEWRNDHGKTQ